MCILCAYLSLSIAAAAPGAHGGPETPLPPPLAPTDQRILLSEETHLRNVRQLTFGHSPDFEGQENAANYAEAYWSPDGGSVILQVTRDEFACDHMFCLDMTTGAMRLVGPREGRSTCGYFRANGTDFIFSSTHETLGPDCPPPPDMSKGYVWPIYDYDIYMGNVNHPGEFRNITNHPCYNAEGTIDWHNGWMYFTSNRDGDMDIYRQHLDSGEVQRLTDEIGYDGGPFVSYDGRTIVYRRQAVTTPEEIAAYKELLAARLVRPSALEIWSMNADGSHKHQLTGNGKANFAPFLHPENRTLIFCSNMDDPKGRDFDLYTLDLAQADGAGFPPPTRITYTPEFDGFPMFSPDGKYLLWCSNRNHAQARETNVFVAEWIP
jgi:TolB protein